ncbi:hypothetical protein V6N13_034126 [Hibiscus sabdariffa]
MVTRKKRIEEFETVATTEICLALMHNKVPAKKTDPGSFTIECFNGHNYPTKALCDPGASINLMPISVFQKLGIGEAKPIAVMLQLADHSYVQPEGKIEDILVQIENFIFPADFLILDFEADEHAPIILGRPFLSTSRAVIDFDKDEIIFKVDENNVKMKSITKKLDKGKGIAESPAKDTPRTKLYMGAHVERDRAAILARQPAQANYNWVIEFYANNAAGEDFSIVRGRRVPTTAATINAILGLSDAEPSFYAMLGGFEEVDFELIKDFLCEENTAWNTTGRNPNLVSRLSLRPKAKLWNTFVKRNLMPTSHNQTVDRTRLLLIHTILTGGQQYPPAPETNTSLRRLAGCKPHTCVRWMWHLNMAMPTPPASPTATAVAPTEEAGPSAPAAPEEPQRTPPPSPPVVPVSSHTTSTSPATSPAGREHNQDKTPDTPLGTTPSSLPSPLAPTQSEETAPLLHILQLRSQLQRIEARQLQFQEEMKVFNKNLIKFLCFQFPSVATFFAQPSSPPPQPSVFATATQPSTNTSAKAGATEELHFSSDDENNVFDWQSPRDHLQPYGPTTTPAPAVPILSAAPIPTTSAVAEHPTQESLTKRKGKAKAGIIIGSDIPSSPNDDEAEQRPAKRRRKYHVITAESDDDDSTAKIPVARPE